MSDDLLDGILRAIRKSFAVDVVVHSRTQQKIAEKEIKRRTVDDLACGLPANQDVAVRCVAERGLQHSLPVGTLLPRRRKK